MWGMPPDTTSHAYQLADRLLDGRLQEFVADRRSRSPQLSWRHIARDLHAETGVDVSDQTLMNWFPEYRPRFVAS
jgi:hypothetical protein